MQIRSRRRKKQLLYKSKKSNWNLNTAPDTTDITSENNINHRINDMIQHRRCDNIVTVVVVKRDEDDGDDDEVQMAQETELHRLCRIYTSIYQRTKQQ